MGLCFLWRTWSTADLGICCPPLQCRGWGSQESSQDGASPEPELLSIEAHVTCFFIPMQHWHWSNVAFQVRWWLVNTYGPPSQASGIWKVSSKCTFVLLQQDLLPKAPASSHSLPGVTVWHERLGPGKLTSALQNLDNPGRLQSFYQIAGPWRPSEACLWLSLHLTKPRWKWVG